MKITKITFRGETRWRINEEQSATGKRKRTLFSSREAAEQYAKERTKDMARADASAPAAYNALLPDGRFAAQLNDSGGNLTWKLIPETENKQLAAAANS